MYYDSAGRQIDQAEFVRLFAFDSYRRVEFTTLPDGTTVSTVWLGLDHGLGRGPPLIFETLCSDEEMERYSTIQEARDGHARHVSRLGGVQTTKPVSTASSFQSQRKVDLD